MSQESDGDKYWHCVNSECVAGPQFLLSVGLSFKCCPHCSMSQPGQQVATPQVTSSSQLHSNPETAETSLVSHSKTRGRNGLQ